ncbi:hypothetical protein [Moritella sp.]|uniref:hypothetical protein n=1 Tax=Moritella sp. TaxID=78556 RepID=UPI001D408966|nr:hypothetical protein [Moritella sp.]MCJ8350735.1 hypothetical protein [Moritella sp.]NQZ42649.1 hypothetical protein [Moritella sp.]
MAWYDDMSDFGADFLDDVGEGLSSLLDDAGDGLGNLIDGATLKTKKEASTNSKTIQQPDAPVKDNHGNAVTGRVRHPQPADKTLWYIGGGLGVAVVFIGLIIALKN